MTKENVKKGMPSYPIGTVLDEAKLDAGLRDWYGMEDTEDLPFYVAKEDRKYWKRGVFGTARAPLWLTKPVIWAGIDRGALAGDGLLTREADTFLRRLETEFRAVGTDASDAAPDAGEISGDPIISR